MQLQKTDLAKSPIFLVSPFFFLGTAMVVMKYILPHTSPLFLAAFRLLPAGLLTLIVAAVLKLPQPKTWKAWLWIALFALVDGAMFQGLLTTGLVNTGAGLGAVLIDAQPLVVALLARILFGSLIGPWGWLGLTIGIAGISLCGLPAAWIYSLWDGGIPVASWLQSLQGYGTGEGVSALANLDLANLLQSGEFLMLLAALSMSVGTILMGYVKRHADPIVATGWHMILGGIPLAVLSAVWEPYPIDNLLVGDWLGLVYATVFGTALTYGMFFYLAANGNMTSVSALIFLTPVFALLFSALFLGETLNNLQWGGVVLTLVSVYLVNQREQIEGAIAQLTQRVSPAVVSSISSGSAGESAVPPGELSEVDAATD
ncbi:MAG: EamA family transporter [Phormidesmis sp. RL_2_1]|nr:EamA family transporter [Phormidesmis sp. RL_2_1]